MAPGYADRPTIRFVNTYTCRYWRSWCSSVIHCIRRISLVFTDVNADDVHPINEFTGINPRTMPDFVSTGRLRLPVGNMPVPEWSNTLFFVCSRLELTIAPETNDSYGTYALGLDRISDAVGPCYYTRGEEDNERATPWVSSLDDQYHCFYYFNTYFFEWYSGILDFTSCRMLHI